jgi:hypothetical protein
MHNMGEGGVHDIREEWGARHEGERGTRHEGKGYKAGGRGRSRHDRVLVTGLLVSNVLAGVTRGWESSSTGQYCSDAAWLEGISYKLCYC